MDLRIGGKSFSAWNGSNSGYQQSYGGGPMRSNYSSGSRSTPYGKISVFVVDL